MQQPQMMGMQPQMVRFFAAESPALLPVAAHAPAESVVCCWTATAAEPQHLLLCW